VVSKSNPFNAAIETLYCDLADMRACVGPPTCHNHSQRIKEYEAAIRVLETAEELLEVADLRGDSELPHPSNDPKLWSARMQTAWDELRAALAYREGEK